MRKKCPTCHKHKVVKNGKRGGKQRFLCKTCNHVWEHGSGRNTKNRKVKEIYHRYVSDELKYRQIAQELKISNTAVKNMLDKLHFDVFFVKI